MMNLLPIGTTYKNNVVEADIIITTQMKQIVVAMKSFAFCDVHQESSCSYFKRMNICLEVVFHILEKLLDQRYADKNIFFPPAIL